MPFSEESRRRWKAVQWRLSLTTVSKIITKGGSDERIERHYGTDSNALHR